MIAETLVPCTAVMAFMAMRRNLDDRQQKRELDAIFAKFDKNQNGIICMFCWLKIPLISYVLHHTWLGRILMRDFLSEVAEQGHAVSQEEVKNIKKYADSDGQVTILQVSSRHVLCG